MAKKFRHLSCAANTDRGYGPRRASYPRIHRLSTTTAMAVAHDVELGRVPAGRVGSRGAKGLESFAQTPDGRLVPCAHEDLGQQSAARTKQDFARLQDGVVQFAASCLIDVANSGELRGDVR